MSTVLLMLLRYGHISRVQISRMTGLSTTTITNLIAELIDDGIVTQDDIPHDPNQPRSVGRPQLALNLQPGARYTIGIHFGVGTVRAAVMDLLANVIAVDIIHHPLDQPASEVLAATDELVENVMVLSDIDRDKIVGIGVGASGLVEPNSGLNVVAPNMDWFNVPLKQHFTDRFNLPVIVDNNVRAMALGEALFGVGKDVYSMAFVYARIGVGAGIVVGGHLYYGGGAGAGEIGHMIMAPHGGDPCRCGNHGCLETLISEPVILREAAILAASNEDSAKALGGDVEHITLDHVFAAARSGDAAINAMLMERAHYMGLALANLVNIMNPELIVLGGIFNQGKDLLLPVAQETMRKSAFARLGEKVDIVAPSFHTHAGVIGAASLALNHFFYRQAEVPNGI